MHGSWFIVISLSIAIAADRPTVVATVDGRDITSAEVDRNLALSQTPATTSSREAALQELIDRRLMRAFLKKQNVKVPDEHVDLGWQRLVEKAIEQKQDLGAELKRAGLTEALLREDLWLPLAWTAYIKQTVTPPEIESYFNTHRNRFDGTLRRVRHLVIAVPRDASPADWDRVAGEIEVLRKQISTGEISFEDAVQKHSTSPSKSNGGDLGFIHFKGDLPTEVASAAFQAKLREVSVPIRSPFGWHLVLAEDERPGVQSLADVRANVLEAIGRERWTSTLADLRKNAKIEIRTPAPAAR
jgi:parvulin-like peptidyl-prolyl isomerase